MAKTYLKAAKNITRLQVPRIYQNPLSIKREWREFAPYLSAAANIQRMIAKDGLLVETYDIHLMVSFYEWKLHRAKLLF